jgi:hypothetical protein
MKPGDIALGLPGSEIVLTRWSRKVTPTPVEIIKTTRAADGTLLEDVIRRYTNYQIAYEIMKGEDHETIEALYNLGQHLNLIVVDRFGAEHSSTVKMTWTPGDEDTARGWSWNNVSISLEVV